MKRAIINPFVTGGYLSPEYFCNRTEEAERITGAIKSKRNLTLISFRRMGKTGLLKHVKHQLEHAGTRTSVIYADLLPTTNSNELLNSVSTALFRVWKGERSLVEKMFGFMASLRPRLTVDSLTGEPSIELMVESTQEIKSGLEQILRLTSEIKQEIVIMLDEFQQITSYPEKNTESVLRSVIQTYPNVPFVFSGSSKHMLEKMFMSAGSPFYQSSELMYLDRIDKRVYREFIREKFNINSRGIDDSSISRILQWTRVHTYYVQYVCNHLYEKGSNNITEEEVNAILHRIITDFEPQYINYRNLLPSHQFRLLKAIASEDGVSQPTAGKFISENNLTSPSSVSTSLKALADKEMIVNDQGRWQVYDVILSRWLEYHHRES